MEASEILHGLGQAVFDYDPEAAADWARQAVTEKLDPLVALAALTDAIRQVGDGFARCDLFLPDLVGAADALQSAMPIVEEAIRRKGMKRESLGTVVIGTVFGDIHTIGKSMVASLLTAEGFDVHDLGIDVPTEKFVEGVKSYDASILALSALLTTTAPEAKKVIQSLEKEGLRQKVKVMVGGGAITEDFASNIKADGYSPTAPGAIRVAKNLVGLGKGGR